MSKSNRIYQTFMTSMIVAMAGMLIAMGVLAVSKSMKLTSSISMIPNAKIEMHIHNQGEEPTSENLVFRNFASGDKTVYVNESLSSLSANTLMLTSTFLQNLGNEFVITIFNYDTNNGLKVDATSNADLTSNTDISGVPAEIFPSQSGIIKCSDVSNAPFERFNIKSNAILNQTTYIYFTFTQSEVAEVSTTISNATISASKVIGDEPYTAIISADNGYRLPSSIAVSGATNYTWELSQDGTTGVLTIEQANITGDIIVSASSTVATYTITYNLDGGSVATANPTTYTKDTATITLNNPTKTGYTFNGWRNVTIPTGSTGDKTYNAVWTANTYTVTYDKAYSCYAYPTATAYSSGISGTQAYTTNGVSIYYDAADRTFTFNGTMTASVTFGTFANVNMKTSEKFSYYMETISGTYTRTAGCFVLDLYTPAGGAPNNGVRVYQNGYPSNTTGESVESAGQCSISSTVETSSAGGYFHLWMWYNNGGYTFNNFKVRLSAIIHQDVATTTVSYDSNLSNITPPVRTGYAFGGYYTKPLGYGTQYINSSGVATRIWNLTSNTTLYAKWTPNTYILSYDNDYVAFSYSTNSVKGTDGVQTAATWSSGVWTTTTGSHGAGGFGPYIGGYNKNNLVASDRYRLEVTLYTSRVLTISFGFELAGASTSITTTTTAKTYTLDCKINGNASYQAITFYSANWAANDKLTISSIKMKKISSYDSAWGTLFTPSRSSYTFGGWFTGSSGSGIVYTASTKVTGSVSLYGKWS
ncbi:MAG: InlB B-repeat-containing protein [Clostridia bacterium]|nr:InlB B-repeat-containing protein [Clostridia bacterium]